MVSLDFLDDFVFSLMLLQRPLVAMWKVPWPSASMTRLMAREGGGSCCCCGVGSDDSCCWYSDRVSCCGLRTPLGRLLLLLLLRELPLEDILSGDGDLFWGGDLLGVMRRERDMDRDDDLTVVEASPCFSKFVSL